MVLSECVNNKSISGLSLALSRSLSATAPNVAGGFGTNSNRAMHAVTQIQDDDDDDEEDGDGAISQSNDERRIEAKDEEEEIRMMRLERLAVFLRDCIELRHLLTAHFYQEDAYDGIIASNVALIDVEIEASLREIRDLNESLTTTSLSSSRCSAEGDRDTSLPSQSSSSE